MTRLTGILILVAVLAVPAAGEQTELILEDGKWAPQPAPAKGTPEGEAAIVRHELDEGRDAKAVRAAKGFLKRYSLHPLRESVLSMAGDAEMRRGDYWQAHLYFKKQLAEFPKGALSDRAMDRQMQIAKAFLAGRKRKFAGFMKIGAGGDGVDILEDIAVVAPTSDRAEEALMTIGDYYFDSARWDEAAAEYDGFLSLYPKSERVPRARMQAAEAFRRAYRGPAYDETPLIEAEQRYKALLRDHPAAAAEGNAEEILQQIHSDRALKQLTIARFYLRIDRKQAAAFYFRLVRDEYGDTTWGEQAGELLAGLAESPEPVERPTPVEKLLPTEPAIQPTEPPTQPVEPRARATEPPTHVDRLPVVPAEPERFPMIPAD